MEGGNSDFKGAIRLGIELFATDSHFWCLMIEKFIQEQNLDKALLLIDQATNQLEENEREDILLKKVRIMQIQGKDS